MTLPYSPVCSSPLVGTGIANVLLGEVQVTWTDLAVTLYHCAYENSSLRNANISNMYELTCLCDTGS